ncbi:MAG: glycoside hydrolase family 28 protein, partial [Aristaeellaceae bacterium]
MRFFQPFEMPDAPRIPERTVDIRDFGAVEGGEVCNTQAIRCAIDTLSREGGGRVVFPQGRWLTGPIRLRSGMELHLEKGCEVIFSTRKEDYLPAVFTLYEGMRCYTYSAQLYACDCHDIAITGEGTFDGQGFVWWYMAAVYPEGAGRLHEACVQHVPVEQRVFNTEQQGLRPGMLHFVSCRNVLIEGCTFRFSPFWTLHPAWCENIIVRSIRVINPYDHAPNTDGCNLEGCRRGLVEDVWVDTGDDAVCLKAGRDEDGRLQNRPCEDIVIRRITARRSHGGVTIGSEMSSGVRNVLVED